MERVMPDTGADQSPRRFAPGWPLWLFTLGFLPILLALGFWQLDRAEQKRELQTRMEQRREAPPLALEDISTTRDPAWRRLQLRALGCWQLVRAVQNLEVRTRVGQRREAPPLALEAICTARDPAWRRLELPGQFDPGYVWLLDNRTRNGEAGVAVLQLFHVRPG